MSGKNVNLPGPLFGDIVLFNDKSLLPIVTELPYGIITGNKASGCVALSFDTACYKDEICCLSFGKKVTPAFDISDLEYEKQAITMFWNCGPDKKGPKVSFNSPVNLWRCIKPLKFYEPLGSIK